MFLVFGTDNVYQIDETTLGTSTSIQRTSVSTIVNMIAQQESTAADDTTDVSLPGLHDATLIVNGDTIDMSNALIDTGCVNFCYTYMSWQSITSHSSNQWVLRNKYYPNWDSRTGASGAFDSEGFSIINGRYVIAVTWANDGGIALVGDELDVYLENGTVLNCVVGDIKSSGDADWTVYGHKKASASGNTHSLNTVEFIVNRQQWHDHVNPGTPTCHPEWKSNIIKIVKGQNLLN
jgi:hypothetical protein